MQNKIIEYITIPVRWPFGIPTT